ncbi:hypothetical protein BDZ89DRAFT_768195 [Hymenopellis radicata]|nr:hypothetical protein BDZ89DRAFT_768195 [Hymenopellis radicata]
MSPTRPFNCIYLASKVCIVPQPATTALRAQLADTSSFFDPDLLYIAQRILRSALTQWTNRLIDVKLQEIEVKQHYEVGILMNA